MGTFASGFLRRTSLSNSTTESASLSAAFFRRFDDEAAVTQTVKEAGFDPFEHKLLGITAMQRMLGKARFDELLTAYIEKPQGR